MPFKTKVKNTRIQFIVESDEHVNYDDSILDQCVYRFLGANRPGGVTVDFDEYTAVRTTVDPIVMTVCVTCGDGRHADFTHTYDKTKDDPLVTIDVQSPGFRDPDLMWINGLVRLTRDFFFENGVFNFTMKAL